MSGSQVPRKEFYLLCWLKAILLTAAGFFAVVVGIGI
jgi:hypothetical protein